MTITFSFDLDKPLIITTAGNCTPLQVDSCHESVQISRIAYLDVPRFLARVRTYDTDITT